MRFHAGKDRRGYAPDTADLDAVRGRRRLRSIAGAVACIALVIGVIAFVAARIIPETPEGPTALAKHFDDLSFPDSLEVVASGIVGGGPELFGDRAAAVQVYASSEPPAAVCGAIEGPLREWGTILGGSATTSESCGFSGRIAEGSEAEFHVVVVPRQVYLERAGSGDFYWEDAATSSFPTVVEIELLT